MNAILYLLAAAAAAVLGYVVLTGDDALNPEGRQTKISDVTGAGYWKAGAEAWLVQGKTRRSANWVDLIVVKDIQAAKVYALAWKQRTDPGSGWSHPPVQPAGQSKV